VPAVCTTSVATIKQAQIFGLNPRRTCTCGRAGVGVGVGVGVSGGMGVGVEVCVFERASSDCN